jgi:hypothetical protein
MLTRRERRGSMAMREHWELLLQSQKIVYEAIMRLDRKVDEMNCAAAPSSRNFIRHGLR